MTTTETLPSLARYARHLAATTAWLERSIDHGNGGSCAHFSLARGWSRPYPETTGYLIPTLFELGAASPERGLPARARELARWLLTIQNADGSWNGGLHPTRNAQPSVFNTGQVLLGLVEAYRETGELEWLDAASRGARWLAGGVGEGGLWPAGDYRAADTPTYYSHVAWPMLEVWSESGEGEVRAAAERALGALVRRRTETGSFTRWGFGEDGVAHTHTIAYTLRGFLEAARLLDAWDEYGEPCVLALETMARRAELRGGRLHGEFDGRWRATGEYVCLTGNAQTAINLLQLERRAPDLRLVNAAAKLVDVVCDAQHLRHPVPGVRGAVAGSAPVWGRYMMLRYPNWAAKYHAEALMRLTERLEREQHTEAAECASS